MTTNLIGRIMIILTILMLVICAALLGYCLAMGFHRGWDTQLKFNTATFAVNVIIFAILTKQAIGHW
jgi:hypothetical protein